MMKYFQKLGKALMLPVAVLPAAAILMGIGYLIDPNVMAANADKAPIAVAVFLVKAGGAIIDNLPILFAVGVALGMTKKKDGAAALSGLVAYLVVTTILKSDNIALAEYPGRRSSTCILKDSKCICRYSVRSDRSGML